MIPRDYFAAAIRQNRDGSIRVMHVHLTVRSWRADSAEAMKVAIRRFAEYAECEEDKISVTAFSRV